jgi:hypothetical protein
MPYEDRDQDRDENDDNDAYGSRSAPTAIIDYNRAICHTNHCSFRSSQPTDVIPRVQASVPGSGEASGMWVWSGFGLAVVLAGVALWRSRAPVQGFYEGEAYGLTPESHRRWSGGFAALAVALALSATPTLSPAQVPLLAVLALAGILYGAGFLRGASGEDE